MAGFYDLDEVKSIPILDVCDFLGIPWKRSGKTYWCKLRPEENTASCQLNVENGSKHDWFYDHGSHVGGDVIRFAQECIGCSWQDALDNLAGTFGVQSLSNSDYMNRTELSDHEYKKIGVYGDLATKNMEFPFDKYSIEYIKKMSEMFSMPVNQLRKEFPDRYAIDIMYKRAIPTVYRMRNTYYFALYCAMASQKAVTGKFDINNVPPKEMADLQALCKEVTQGEKILGKALKGTGIHYSYRDYNIAKDLAGIHLGKIEFEIGEHTYADLKRGSKYHGVNIAYRPVSVAEYLTLGGMGLNSIYHAAYLRNDRVNIAFWAENEPEVDKLLDRYEKDKELVPIHDAVFIEYKGIVFDDWSLDEDTGDVIAQACGSCVNKYKDVLTDELSAGEIGVCSIKGCENIEEGNTVCYKITLKPEFIRPLGRGAETEVDKENKDKDEMSQSYVKKQEQEEHAL